MLHDEQREQIKTFEDIIPSIPEQKWRARARKKVRLFKSQDGLCCLCEKPMKLAYAKGNGQYASFEHVKVRSKGGTSSEKNVPLSHGTCNQRRGVADFDEYKQKIKDNNGIPPKTYPTKISKLRKALSNDEAMEHILAKKLALELYIMKLETENIEPVIPLSLLKEKLERPLCLR